MNSKHLLHEVIFRIKLPYGKEEVTALAYLIIHHIFSLSRTQIIAEVPIEINATQHKILQEILSRVNTTEPIQYILEEADFYGRKFFVNKNVLIPRPETEELVREVIAHIRSHHLAAPKIVDIGTGSGCIPVTLKLELPTSQVHATDISMAALEVAKENANKLSANIQLHYHNILSQHLDEHGFDVVVSNPPYIKQSEAATMEENVLRYEPHLALFVPDEDALKFYKAICSEAMRILKPQGLLAVEVNASHANEVAELFADNDFKSVTIVKDLYGKDRIVKALKPT